MRSLALNPEQNTSPVRSRVKASGDSFMLNSFFPAPQFYRSRTNFRFLRGWMGESLAGSGDYRFIKAPLAGFTFRRAALSAHRPRAVTQPGHRSFLFSSVYLHPRMNRLWGTPSGQGIRAPAVTADRTCGEEQVAAVSVSNVFPAASAREASSRF